MRTTEGITRTSGGTTPTTRCLPGSTPGACSAWTASTPRWRIPLRATRSNEARDFLGGGAGPPATAWRHPQHHRVRDDRRPGGASPAPSGGALARDPRRLDEAGAPPPALHHT